MVSPVDIFEKAVDEALHAAFDTNQTTATVGAMLVALTKIVEELEPDYVVNELTPLLPALVTKRGEAEISVSDLWTDNSAFVPIYAIMAKVYYDTVADSLMPNFPKPLFVPDQSALFGLRFEGFEDIVEKEDGQEWVGLFAGCCVSAVTELFNQPATLVVAYVLAATWFDR